MLSSYLDILTTLFPYVLTALCGAVFGKYRLIAGEKITIFTKILINLLIPSFIFTFVVGNPVLKNISSVIYVPLGGFYSIVLGFFVGFLFAKLFKLKDKKTISAFVFTMGIYNYGFLALPLCDSLFGASTVGVMLVYNVGVDLAYWGVGVTILNGFRGGGLKKLLTNPPLIAVIVSLCINSFGFDEFFTFGMKSIPAFIGMFSIPAGLFISGVVISESLSCVRLSDYKFIASFAVIIRLLIIPCLIILPVFVVEIPVHLKKVFVIQSAMPAGMLSIAIVRYFSCDTKISMAVIVPTTLVGLITIPLWILSMMSLLGL
jgi:predicted permease